MQCPLRSHRVPVGLGFEPSRDGRSYFVRALRLVGFKIPSYPQQCSLRSHRVPVGLGFEPSRDGRSYFVRALRLVGFKIPSYPQQCSLRSHRVPVGLGFEPRSRIGDLLSDSNPSSLRDSARCRSRKRRWDWDLNPGIREDTCFQGRRVRPLRHPTHLISLTPSMSCVFVVLHHEFNTIERDYRSGIEPLEKPRNQHHRGLYQRLSPIKLKVSLLSPAQAGIISTNGKIPSITKPY